MMKHKRYFLWITVFLLGLSGCKSFFTEEPIPRSKLIEDKKIKYKDATPPTDFRKTGIVLLSSTFSTLHPYADQDFSAQMILKNCYQSLLTTDTTGKIIPELAAEYDLTEDTMSCHIRLSNRRFHDDSEVTAQDVVYSWRLAGNSQYGNRVKPIKKISAVEGGLKVEFLQPGIFNLYSLDFPIVKNKSLEQGNPYDINGTGNYRLQEYRPMRSLTLVSDSNILEISLARDDSVQETAFLNGRLDVYFTEEFPWFSFSEETLSHSISFSGNSFYSMGFHPKSRFFADVKVRKYFWNKLNFDKMRKNAFLNHIVRQHLPIPGGYSWEQEMEKMQEVEAYDLMADAPVASNEKIRLIYPKAETSLEIIANFLKKEWEVETDLEIIALEEAEYLEKLQTEEFDLYLSKIKIREVSDIRDFLGQGGKYHPNYLFYQEEIRSILGAPDEQECKTRYLNLAKKIQEDGWVFPIGFLENAVILSNQIDGVITPKADFMLYGMEGLRMK